VVEVDTADRVLESSDGDMDTFYEKMKSLKGRQGMGILFGSRTKKTENLRADPAGAELVPGKGLPVEEKDL
jgi:hypothetical protein